MQATELNNDKRIWVPALLFRAYPSWTMEIYGMASVPGWRRTGNLRFTFSSIDYNSLELKSWKETRRDIVIAGRWIDGKVLTIETTKQRGGAAVERTIILDSLNDCPDEGDEWFYWQTKLANLMNERPHPLTRRHY